MYDGKYIKNIKPFSFEVKGKLKDIPKVFFNGEEIKKIPNFDCGVRKMYITRSGKLATTIKYKDTPNVIYLNIEK